MAAVVAKLLITPTCNLLITVAAFHAGVIPTSDVLLPLCLVILGASPTAMNLSTIASLAGAAQKEVSIPSSQQMWAHAS